MTQRICLVVSAMLLVAALSAQAADSIEPEVATCAACHGNNGVPRTPEIPPIWGQPHGYLYKQLHDYHSGARENAIMSPLVKRFTLEQLRSMAGFFSAKTWPAKGGPAAAGPKAPSRGLETCHSCHGEHYEGGASGPRLAGLSYAYLLAQMNGFATGGRSNNSDMSVIMRSLNERERDAIAHYLSAL